MDRSRTENAITNDCKLFILFDVIKVVGVAKETAEDERLVRLLGTSEASEV